jgi:hypothetical protein
MVLRAALLTLLVLPARAVGQEPARAGVEEPSPPSPAATREERRGTLWFLGGAATGLVLHEGGHLLFDGIFDADPGFRRVELASIPFFAVTHTAGLPPAQEFTISSGGFWVQNATSEWILTRRPNLRDEHAPFAKGVLAFNVLASVTYSAAAFARVGPAERDTRGMADALGIDEPWVGAMILAPAALDAWRYYHPDSRWARWTSRAVKVGLVLAVIGAK